MLRRLCFALVLLASSLAHANVRAPVYIDDVLSGAVSSLDAADGVELVREMLRVEVMPLDGDTDRASVVVEYQLMNHGARRVLPVAFLATNIDRPTIRVNDAPPEHYAVGRERDVVWDEFVAKLREHRETWHPEVYQSGTSDGLGSPDAAASLEQMRFDLVLEPGANTLGIHYFQRLFVNENSTGYGGFHADSAQWGFDYLLYPALTWKRADGFELDVGITVRNFIEPGFFSDDEYSPAVVSNLKLETSGGGGVLSGTFPDFPEPILSFLVQRGEEL